MPDRLYISIEDRLLYEKIEKEIGFLKGKDAKDLFLFALIYGVKYNKKKPLIRKEGFIRTEYLKDEDMAILKVIAIHDENIDVLDKEDLIFDIAERYAHAGIAIIIDQLESSSIGIFDKQFEVELFKLYS